MTLSALLFDLDGTLADTVPVCIQAHQETAWHFTGRFPSESEIYALFGPSEEGILERLIPGRLDETLPYFLARYEQLHDQCLQPFPGVERLFAVLQDKGVRSAIVTGKGAHSAEISMRILGLDRWVEMIETGSAAGDNKPHSMRLVLERWGLPPAQAAYVGDAPTDITGAGQVGVLPIGAAWAPAAQLRSQRAEGEYLLFYEMEQFIRWCESGELIS
jgi:pyrophosphatase PpaX